MSKLVLTFKGGAGSGHHGHGGRKGKRGGSTPGKGGVIGTTPPTDFPGYSGKLLELAGNMSTDKSLNTKDLKVKGDVLTGKIGWDDYIDYDGGEEILIREMENVLWTEEGADEFEEMEDEYPGFKYTDNYDSVEEGDWVTFRLELLNK